MYVCIVLLEFLKVMYVGLRIILDGSEMVLELLFYEIDSIKKVYDCIWLLYL